MLQLNVHYDPIYILYIYVTANPPAFHITMSHDA